MITLVNFEMGRSYKFGDDTQPTLIEGSVTEDSFTTAVGRELAGSFRGDASSDWEAIACSNLLALSSVVSKCK